MMKTILFTMVAAGLVAQAQAQAQAQDADPAAKPGSASEAKANVVVSTLKGALMAVDGDKVKDVELDDGMEYYLVYHSASW